MATDDTSTVPPGQCQLEAWGERTSAERSQIVAPACGVTDAMEVDTWALRSQGTSAAVTGLGLGLKWVPADAVYETALGALSLGLEAGVVSARGPAEPWRADSLVIAALASLAINSSWNVNANLGSVRNLQDHKQSTGLRVALAWQANEHWLLFVEGLASDRANSLWNAGLRWWVLPGTFGVDLVASRYAGSSASVSLGLGWYGLRLP
jgi:hypothetical protein